MGWLAGGPAKMAATNKCLAQSNKSRTGANATKKRNRKNGHRREETKIIGVERRASGRQARPAGPIAGAAICKIIYVINSMQLCSRFTGVPNWRPTTKQRYFYE